MPAFTRRMVHSLSSRDRRWIGIAAQEKRCQVPFRSDWQEGVGDEPVGLDVTKMDLNADPKELAKRIHDPLDRMIKWQAVAKEEREALKSELQKLGLWEVTNAGQ